MIHAVTKSLKEAGDKVSADERTAIERAVEALKEALKGEDKDLIEKKTQELTEASTKMAEHLYGAAGGAGAPGAGEAHAGGAHESQEKKAGDDVVDAEFEEVKDDKKDKE